MSDDTHIYAIALGSNRWRGRERPKEIIASAFLELDVSPLYLLAQSRVIRSAPVGPSLRRYANAAALIETALEPDALLVLLKSIERDYGQRRGQRWGARALDLDILLWSGGIWGDAALGIPHAAFRTRDFVLQPLAEIAAGWRDPVSGLTVRHLLTRNKVRKPVDRIAKAL